jgi:hypothetical protein
MLEESRDQAPIDAVRQCLLKLASRFEVKESIREVVGLLINRFPSLNRLTRCCRSRAGVPLLRGVTVDWAKQCPLWVER